MSRISGEALEKIPKGLSVEMLLAGLLMFEDIFCCVALDRSVVVGD